MPTDPAITRRAFFRGHLFRRAAERALEPAEARVREIARAAAAVTADASAPRGREDADGAARLGPASAPVSARALPSTADVVAAARAERARVPLPVLRPPGALPEAEFLAACTKCDACALACPYGAIVKAPARFRHAAGTPMIDPAASPCRMCPDRPCATACQPGALRKDRPAKMGTAAIQAWNCLAHAGSFCTTCSERCPVPGAIELTAGRPRVVDAACTGCGVCQHACPAPQNAIMILPLRDRPGSAAGIHHEGHGGHGEETQT